MNLAVTQLEKIETERLVLRSFQVEDAEFLKRLFRNPEVTKTFMVPEEFEKSEEKMTFLVNKQIEFSQPEDTKHLLYGIFEDGKPVGFINDCGVEEDEIEIGYVIDPVCKGRGYASEAVTAVIGDLFRMGFRKVSAGYFEENPASRRVMEKCGMSPTDEVDEEEYRGIIHICRNCEILNPQKV